MPGSPVDRPEGRTVIKKVLDSKRGLAYLQQLLGNLLTTFKTQAFVLQPFLRGS